MGLRVRGLSAPPHNPDTNAIGRPPTPTSRLNPDAPNEPKGIYATFAPVKCKAQHTAAVIVRVVLTSLAALTVLTLLTTACNPGMFIEPLTVSEAKFDMPFTGGMIEVQVSHGDWEVERVAVDHIDCELVTDAEGSMRHESNFTIFEIARPQSDKLVLTFEDIMKSTPQEMEIYISNPFQSQVIVVSMGPCTGYEFDRIEYGEAVVTSPEDAYEEAWSVTELYEADAAGTKIYDVFGGTLNRVVWFPAATVVTADLPYAQWYDTLMEFVTGPFEVPVPDAVPTEDATPFITVPFTYDKTVIPMEPADVKATVTLVPGWNNVSMYWGYTEYTMPYTIWFKHAGGGRPRCMTGEFVSRTYDGRWRVEVE